MFSFGYLAFLFFMAVPLTIILIVAWVYTKEKIIAWTLVIIWILIIGTVLLTNLNQKNTAKILLKKSDYYGNYVIDTLIFGGKQAAWQFSNFRFKILENDSIYFYVIGNNKIKKTFRGTISTVMPYQSERLVVNMQQPTHHIMANNPTVYRSINDFYLVFESNKFGNVFFKKENKSY